MEAAMITRLTEHTGDRTTLTDFLREAGYSSPAVCEALGIPGPPYRLLTGTARCAFVYYDEGRAERSDPAALGMLFALGGWLRREVYERAVPAAVRSVLEGYGLVRDADDDASADGAGYVRSTISLVEHRGRFFVSDRVVERTPESIRLIQEGREHVDPPGYPSTSMMETLFGAGAERGDRLLDVGCGTGCLTTLGAETHRRVVGIDVNGRALRFAALGAAVNGVPLALRHADCLGFEDAEGFDRIVFNVPSVPRYRDDLDKVDTYTSTLGHTLAIDFVNRRLPALLRPHGSCSIWSLFAIRSDEGTVEEILRREVEDLPGYDVDVVTETASPFVLPREHVERRTIPRNSYLLADPADAEALFAFLERHGVVAIATALVTLRPKRGTDSRFRAREVETLLPDLGETIFG